MTKNRKNAGFSLAEMLIVIAIVVILMGVAFVAVQNHQRSMTRLEYDNIAKEIFFTAQNHLTTAKSQGYLENKDFGHPGTKTADDPASVKDEDIFYLVSSDTNAIKDLILPEYTMDLTALAGTTYIIRYQPSSAKVLDVFYSLNGKSSLLTVSGTTLTSGDYATLMADSPNYRGGTDGASNRERYNNAVIGWYGGEPAAEVGLRLRAPIFEVINEDTLYVKLTDPNTNKPDGYSLKLIVIGKISEAEKYFDLIQYDIDDNKGRVSESYKIVLDDITKSKMHFADLGYNKPGIMNGFIPGEDLIIKAVAYTTKTLANIAMSAERTTNSLFADPNTYDEDKPVLGSDVKQGVAGITSLRHFENLNADISNLGGVSNAEQFSLSKAVQMNDLDWEQFKSNTDGTKVFLFADTASKDGCMLPVTPQYSGKKPFALSYDGQGHTVSNVKVDFEGPAGLFGTLKEGSKAENIKLNDFDITATEGNAGALVGTAKNTTITNVVAYHTDKTDAFKTPTITAVGDAGGLIGSADNCTVSKSAAALVVKGTTNAGGLIGSATNGGSVTACYSGGHTYSGDPKYAAGEKPEPARTPNAVRYYDADNSPIYNVTATSGKAGGLIGDAGAATISYSYSTCSASGATAGGFVGSSTGSISDCYCTGLVKGTTAEGAFAASSGSVSDSYFFEIINERSNTDSSGKPAGYDYLKPLGNVEADATSGITALDASAGAYNTFSGAPANWKEAAPYDAGGTESYGLKVYYKYNEKTRYNLQTVEQLGATLEKDSDGKVTDFVSTHYGDWPAPEEFIFN